MQSVCMKTNKPKRLLDVHPRDSQIAVEQCSLSNINYERWQFILILYHVVINITRLDNQ